MTGDITCQQIRFSCSGRLHHRTDTMPGESPFNRPVSRLIMRIQFDMPSGRKLLQIPLVRNSQPIQFKIQCFREKTTVCDNPKIGFSIPFANGRQFTIIGFRLRTAQRMFIPNLFDNRMNDFWLKTDQQITLGFRYLKSGITITISQ